MFFCPKCNFNLNISENIANKNTAINNPEKFIEIGEDLDDNVSLNFTKEQLKTSKVFEDLSDIEQSIAFNKYDELGGYISIGSYFTCNNCNFTTNINPKTSIYKVKLDNSSIRINNNMDIKCYDNTLPRTKDYICPNKDCTSNKKNNAEKEAIFYRESQSSYKITYICCNCKTSFSP